MWVLIVVVVCLLIAIIFLFIYLKARRNAYYRSKKSGTPGMTSQSEADGTLTPDNIKGVLKKKKKTIAGAETPDVPEVEVSENQMLEVTDIERL